MAGQALNELAVEKATTEGKPQRLIADNKQANLYLRVLQSGRKSWLLRARVDGAWKVITLGEWRDSKNRAGHHKHPHLTVAQARLKAASALERSLHPSAVRLEKVTVKQAADQWYRDRVENQYRRPGQTKLYLDRDLAPIASKPISRVTRAEITKLVAAKPPTAGNRLLAIVKQLFRHAVIVGWLEADPLSVLTRRNAGTIEKPRARVLTDDEIRRAWAIPGQHGNVYRMLLATGQRIGEVLALADDTTQVHGDTWLIEDNKSGRPHRVPVMPLMKWLVKDGLAKKKRCAAWSMWKGKIGTEATLHDVRRTVATRMRNLRVPVEVIEALLNHSPPRLVRTYQQPDMTPQITDALKLWHRELKRIVTAHS